MPSHQKIDRRSLAMARAIVERIDADPARTGLSRARATCTHWMTVAPSPAVREWQILLAREWEAVRAILLRDDEEGARLRQNSPFTDVLTPRERWAFYGGPRHEPRAA
jgi:hypothetical protein